MKTKMLLATMVVVLITNASFANSASSIIPTISAKKEIPVNSPKSKLFNRGDKKQNRADKKALKKENKATKHALKK